MPTLHHATLDRIDPATLYRIMVLRTDVFVFEQGIVSEPELDGRDLEPTLHLGRVATAAPARGRGLAGQLLEAVFEAFPAPIEISA